MDRRRALRAMALLSLAGCTDRQFLAEPCVRPAPLLPPSLNLTWAGRDWATDAASVADTQQLMEALRAGRNAIRLTGPISPPAAIDLHDYIPNSFFALEGAGGFTGAGQVFCPPEGPAFRARRFADKERHWEIRLRGLAFEGKQALDLDYLQLSLLEDLRFNGMDEPFVLGADTLNLVELRDLFLVGNRRPGRLLNASDFRWRGGTIEDHAYDNPDSDGGVIIEGPPRNRPNSYPGPGLIEDVHQEFSRLRVRGVSDLSFYGGYRWYARVDFDDCPNLYFPGTGTWAHSDAYRDGRRVRRCA